MLEAAGSFFTSRLTDTLTAIDSAGSDHFTIQFENPSSGTTVHINDVDIAADTVRIYAGARELGGSVLGQAGPGEFNVTGSLAFITNANLRGQGATFNSVDGPTATEFSLWGGAIAFDVTTVWNFDLDSGPAAGRSDFLSVALHEFGHVFGIGVTDSWLNAISGTNFTGVAAVASHGGAVPVTGDLAHWAEGTSSHVAAGPESFIGLRAGLLQEASLDPSLQVGLRKLVTDLDLAALDDIGWDVVAPAAVPLPAGAWLLMSGAALLLVRRRTLG